MPKVLGEILPSGGNFALVDSSRIRGGFTQVNTIEERDTIISDLLKEGMMVYVVNNKALYKWENNKWKLFELNSALKDCEFISPCTEVSDNFSTSEEVIEDYNRIKFVDAECFQAGDIIGWDIIDNNDGTLSGTYTEVVYVYDDIVYTKNTHPIPSVGTTVYLVGSSSNSYRRSVLVKHRISGAYVITQFLNISIDSLNTAYTFRLGYDENKYWKLYGEDVYLKGTFIDSNGRNLSEIATVNQEAINAGLVNIRREFGYDNLLNNPYFIEGLDCWLTKNAAKYFKVNGKFVLTNKTMLTTKKTGAYVTIEDGLAILRIINGYAIQRNENLKEILDFDELTKPYYVTLVCTHKIVEAGDLAISIENETNEGYDEAVESVKFSQDNLQPSEEYGTFRVSFLWNGTGDFKLNFTGEIKIQSIVIRVNELKSFEKKYAKLLEYSDALIEIAEQYINSKS